MIQVLGRPLRGFLRSLPKPRRPEPRTAQPSPMLLALQAGGPGMTQIGPRSGPNALLTGAIVLESKSDPAVTCIQLSMAPQWPQDRVQTSSLPLKTLGARPDMSPPNGHLLHAAWAARNRNHLCVLRGTAGWTDTTSMKPVLSPTPC